MAWASKKQYAILMSSEEGKDLAEQLGEMEQDEFNKKFSELMGKSGESTSEEKSNSNKDNEEEAKKKWLGENGYESEDEVPWWERDDNEDDYEDDDDYSDEDYKKNESERINRLIDTINKEIDKVQKYKSGELKDNEIYDEYNPKVSYDEQLNNLQRRKEKEITNLKNMGYDYKEQPKEEEEEANEILGYFKKAGVDIIDVMPEGWKETKGATTAPLGYKWVDNNKSRFGGERKRALLKLNK